MRGPHRVVDDLERLAQARCPRRPAGGCGTPRRRGSSGASRAHTSRQISMISRVRVERAVVGHAVEALDHLGARGAETEDAATARHGIDAGRRHGDQRRRAAVDRQDGRADLDPLGLGGQVAHEARGVEAVGLGHPDDVEPDLLQLRRLAGRLLEPAGVVQRHGQLHAVLPFLGLLHHPAPARKCPQLFPEVARRSRSVPASTQGARLGLPRPRPGRRPLVLAGRACANMPPWLPTARCCVSCRASATTSRSSGPRARTASCASCAATPAGSTSTRRALCAHAASPRDVAPQEVSGRGHVETFTVNYQQWIPGSDPYIIAWVSIDEQPDVRLTTNLVDVEPEDVRIGMPVRVRLRARRGRVAPALHAGGGGVVSPRPTEEPLERRAIISGIGQSDVGPPAGALRPRPDRGGGLAAIADAGSDPRRHRRALDLPGHGRRDAGLRRPDHARGPGRPGPLAQLARRRRRGRRPDAGRHRGVAGRRRRPGPARARLPHRDRGLGPGHGRPPAHGWLGRRGLGPPLRQLHAVVTPLRRRLGRQLDRHGGPAPHARVRADPRAAGPDRHQRRAATPRSIPRPSTRTRCRWTTTWRRASSPRRCASSTATRRATARPRSSCRTATSPATSTTPPCRSTRVGTALRGRPSWDQFDDMTTMAARDAAASMWERTDLTPTDVDTAQLYDGFSVLTIVWLEALGFCGRGESGPFIEGGANIARDGLLPLNTAGGQLSGGRLHGFSLIHEACVQLRGEGGERQVVPPGRPQPRGGGRGQRWRAHRRHHAAHRGRRFADRRRRPVPRIHEPRRLTKVAHPGTHRVSTAR